MAVNQYQWIYYIPTLVMILFCIGAICYAVTRSSEYHRPKTYVVVALLIMLLCQAVFPLAFSWVNSRVNLDNPVLIASILNLLITMAMIFSITLLISAAFMDRERPPSSSGWDQHGIPLADAGSDNPYASPRQ